MLEPIRNLPKEQIEMLTYLCDWVDLKTAPVTWSIHSYATNYTPPHARKDIPYVLSSNILFERLVDEHKERGIFNDNH